jgi:hypothetical protein
MQDILTAKKGDKVYYYSKHGGKELIEIKDIIRIYSYQGNQGTTLTSIGMCCVDIIVESKKRNIYALEDLKFE